MNLQRYLIPGVAALLLTACAAEKKDNYNLGGLPNQNEFRNGETSLRNGLPPTGILSWEVERALVNLQEQVEERQWIEGKDSAIYALEVIGRNYEGLLAQAPPSAQDYTRQALQKLRTGVRAVEDAIYKKDQSKGNTAVRQMYWYYDLVLLGILSEYDPGVPADWQNRPLLKGGWAIAEFETTQGKFTMILDGFNAPVTSGNVIDLIQRGYYDNLMITRAERQFVVELGTVSGSKPEFSEASTGKIRYVPLELREARNSRQGKAIPTINRETKWAFSRYELDPIKLREELKKIYDQYVAGDVVAPLVYNKPLSESTPLALPYTPPGTFAMERVPSKPDSGSALFYLSFADPELMPPGSNVESGRYGVFGYLTAGEKTTRQLRVGDTIKKARLRTCSEPEFINVVLSDYTATTLYVDQLTQGTLEMKCLPIPAPRLVNVTGSKLAQLP